MPVSGLGLMALVIGGFGLTAPVVGPAGLFTVGLAGTHPAPDEGLVAAVITGLSPAASIFVPAGVGLTESLELLLGLASLASDVGLVTP